MIATVSICLLIGVLCAVRYCSLNRLVPSPGTKEYKIGETVNIGGYAFTLQQVEMLDGNGLKRTAPNVKIVTNADGTAYDQKKIRAVFFHVRLQKKGEGNESVDFTRVSAESGAWGNGINAQLFMTLNPGVSIEKNTLKENEALEVILPFSMVDTMFKKSDWEKIDERKFSVVLQLYPEKILLTQ